MKKKFIFLILFLIIVLCYVTNISQIPSNVILLPGENLNIKKLYGIELIKNKNDIIETWQEDSESQKIDVRLLGKIKVKEISVTTIPKTKVIPIGNLIGLKLYTNGVLVIGLAELTNIDNEIEKPYEKTNIIEGDTILELNNVEIDSVKTLQNIVNEAKGNEIDIKYVHNGEIITSKIKPMQINKSEYRLGLWVRDSASGIGTISFYEPNSKKFAALGHGISDSDTEELLNIQSGEVVTSKVVSMTKGEKGIPGEIKGSITNGTLIGSVKDNTDFGIFGQIDDISAITVNDKYKNGIEIASRDEIEIGEAKILCSTEDGKSEEYDIKILDIYKNNDIDNKSMEIKITDSRLIEKTGGIICGMSGSPIIQNGKLIGVLTNVLVSNPEIGYGVFADIMIKNMMK